MAKKIQLQDANGNVLHPLTLGECVTMDNGENLDTLMSKSQMFTPTITQDKSMFKVGTGVDVDYSANVKDGAYESLVFKGRSLVNLSNLHKSFNDVTLSDYYVDTSLCETSKLKLGTPYTLVFYTTVHGGDHDIYNTIELGVGNTLHGTNAHPKTTTNHRGTLVKNGWSKVCVTFTDFLGYKYLSLRPIRCNAPESGKSIRFSIEGFILLEGDWSNKDLPFNDYFDGIGYCKMPILRNVGENLSDGKLETGRYTQAEGEKFTDASAVRTINKIKVKPSTKYCLRTMDGTTIYNISEYHDGAYIGYKASGSNLVFTTSPMTNGLHISFKTNNINLQYQLEEGSIATTYEPYKTNILRTSEEIVLREVGGVCDTYNPLTGEYVKRIGEIILNGTEKWGNFRDETDTTWRTSFSLPDAKPSSVCICDKFIHSKGATEEKVKVYITVTPNLSITVLKSEFPTLEAFKTWLSQNLVTVQYELAEPVIAIVKPSTMTPFAYQNGHVIVESGHEGQSLLPEIEYSVVTGRTGQVTQNTKVLRKQEQQIISLEELLLTQVVQMEYERTLLQFDYELQMMMLG